MYPFKTPITRAAYAYWLSKHRERRLPSRDDIRPEEITTLLPFVFLVDVIGEAPSFRFRLVGTRLSVWARREFTGVAINEAEYGSEWRNVHDDYVAAVLGRVPSYAVRDKSPWPDRDFLAYERIVMPLSNDGITVNMLFGVLHMIPYP